MTKRLAALASLLTLGALAAAPAAMAAPKPVSIDFVGRTAAGGEATAEIAAFDPQSATVYATNADGNSLDLYDFSDPMAPTPTDSIDLSPYGGGPNGVDFSARKGGIVAVAVEAADKTDPGTVELFDAEGAHLRTIAAGALPDMLTFAKGGKLLLVANEGEPSDEGVDPPGSVSIINLKKFGKPKVRTAGLGNAKLRGPVRIFTPGSTQGQDLEPEYITVAGERAFVSIQEANAVGVIDLKKKRFKYVRSMGFKDHGLDANALDPSDEDGIEIEPWENVFGMYQPDAVAAYSLKAKKGKGKAAGKKGKKKAKRTYIVTANEGDARDWDFFAEEERVGDLTLDPDAFAADAIEDENLGRLNVTTTLGDTDDDDDYDELYAFGGRSLSVLDRKAKVAFDTGSLFEDLTADIAEADFNKDNAAGSDPDNRSDNKGPEPEGVDVGKVGKRKYAFLGFERQGGLVAFDLSDRKGKAGFAGYANTREDDLGPEGVHFVPAGKSPTGNPLILVTYEITGTISAYEISKG